jgi:2-polyprenyl-3-methyl-5-hydroxy-6-metoxy-1,4-benzoquinol methylase
MKSRLKNTLFKIVKLVSSLFNLKSHEAYDFNKSNPLGGDGERVDIQINSDFKFEKLDIYQKSHFKRYEFAKDLILTGEVCGDFACGTGYGSILLSEKASKVVGADINDMVIQEIKERYNSTRNVIFLNENLLNLKYKDYFDTIISYETIEHFTENDILKLLDIFRLGLKNNGKLIFSTPYMQERSVSAEKLGFHLTFHINEEKIKSFLLQCGFEPILFTYQNYLTHNIECDIVKRDFIICVAKKINK